MWRRVGLGILGALVLASCPGCGGAEDDLPRQRISGKVTLGGQSLAGGFIQFFPTNEAMATQVGTFIKDGSYAIARDEGPVPGTYRVIIKSPVAPDAAAATDPAPPDSAPPDSVPVPRAKRKMQFARELVPAKYNAQSALTATVKAGDSNVFNFELEN